MKVIAPKPFTYRGGERAVLLLHGFTGSTVDVKKLGKHLQQHGYTCHAPLYKGHGLEPDELIQTGPTDWWKDVVNGYDFLKAEGYKEVVVAGVSLGGVFSLKAGAELLVKGIVSMCAPVQEKAIEDFYGRVHNYAKAYKQFEGKGEEQIRAELKEFEQKRMPSLKDLQQIILDTRGKLGSITAPIRIFQGCLDAPLYKESAQIIYDTVKAEDKQLKWYEQSGHIITLGQERETVYEDVRAFLDTLDWRC